MTEHKMEVWISSALRLGVLFSGVLLAIGLIFSLQFEEIPLRELLHGGRQLYSPPPFNRHFFDQSLASIFTNIGILFLICLPIGRVGLTVVIFIVQRDPIFTFLSGVVLLILFYGLIVQTH